ncbi:hypothetical protein CCR75_006885 [Bremia lactucae]|uniref:Uncharacterized protein n=1 Tax=Bremia lactucae TaxID=4779 RepID=A0A976FJA1_BRELC|nr:hypothetical protein CCR75_006885 [Bremia lactucae]
MGGSFEYIGASLYSRISSLNTGADLFRLAGLRLNSPELLIAATVLKMMHIPGHMTGRESLVMAQPHFTHKV